MNFPAGHFAIDGNFAGNRRLVTDCGVPETHVFNEVEENVIEEELAAKIETVPKIRLNRTIYYSTSKLQPSHLGNNSESNCSNGRTRDQDPVDEQLFATSTTSNLNARLNVPTSTTTSTSTCTSTSTTTSIYSPANALNRIAAPKAVENKILSLWHTVKYGWNSKLRTNFSKMQPVWLLGKCYHHKLANSNLGASIPQQTLRSPSIASDMMMSSTTLLSGSVQDQVDGGGTTNTSDSSGMTGEDEDDEEDPEPQEAEFQDLAVDVTESTAYEVCTVDGGGVWEDETLNGFRADFCSRLWMTYRREFPLMNNSHYTSDCGWGCMLRSGQMLLAQALLSHFLGRSWRYDAYSQLSNTFEDNIHKKIIKWFGDNNSKGSPFSIHALVELGLKIGKRPGDWYGPASVSILLRDAVKAASSEIVDFDNLVVYVAQDCTIYVGDIEVQCCVPGRTPKQIVPWKRIMESQTTSNAQQQQQQQQQITWKSLIILIPVRLGTDKVNPIYSHWLKLSLSSEYCIGIIGGRPKHSLYFVGFQEDKLIYLDPHYCQEVVDVNQDNFPLQSFHCNSPRKLKISKMDPCCCVGFYCQTRADFLSLQESLQPFTQIPASSSNTSDKQYPLFTFSTGRYSQQEIPVRRREEELSTTSSPRRSLLESSQQNGQNDGHEKDFVLL